MSKRVARILIAPAALIVALALYAGPATSRDGGANQASAAVMDVCGPFYCATDESGVWAHAGDRAEFTQTFMQDWTIQHEHTEYDYDDWHDYMSGGSLESAHSHFVCE